LKVLALNVVATKNSAWKVGGHFVMCLRKSNVMAKKLIIAETNLCYPSLVSF